MGGFLPAAALGVLQLGFEASQRSKQAQMEKTRLEAQTRNQIEQIRRAQQIEELRKQEALKQALATQRARFSAQGVGAGKSADAVLGGLASDVERENKRERELAQLRINRINSQAAFGITRNLLEASQPTYRSAFGLLQRGLRGLPLIDR